MPDYYPLVAKAVAGLEKNTGEGRRALYERARTALVGQLRNMDSPLTESEITRERLALEEAIRKVEAETARRSRAEIGRPAAGAPKPAEASKSEGPEGKEAKPGRPVPAKAPEMDPLRAMAGEQPRVDPDSDKARPAARNRLLGDRPTLTDEGLKGFRDVVAEAESLGEAPAQASKSAREIFAAVPPPSGESRDKIEPRLEPEGLRTPVRPAAPPRPPQTPEWAIERQQTQPTLLEAHDTFEPRQLPQARPVDFPERTAEPRTVLGRPPRQQEPEEIEDRPHRSKLGLVAALLAVMVIVGLGASAFWHRDKIAALFNSVRGQTAQVPREQQPTQPKTQDRVGQPGQEQPRAETPSAPVAQRVVLYEEDPSDPQGKRYVGSAVWRTETISPGPQQPSELAVRADLEIPERRMTMTFSLRRNTDQALPASHTIEILFNLPADFPFGGIANVPGILMKQAEATRGAPLAGLAVKVTSGFFLVGLSAAETDVQRNIQLLKERSWFDVPIVYNNGRRAILALEKGNPGERAFTDAFAAWQQ